MDRRQRQSGIRDRLKGDEITKTLFEDYIGISLRLKIKHPLVGKGYFRVWNDVLGRPREICGRIQECEQDYFARSWSHFTVKYDDMSHIHISEPTRPY